MVKIKDFFLKNEQKIVIIVAFCLISAISFEFGMLQGSKTQSKPLIIEKQVNTPPGDQIAQDGASASPQSTSATASTQNSLTSQNAQKSSQCAFVGSKNSDKFYVPTCSYAKRVKPANLACYTSEADALSKGKVKSDCK